MSSIHLSIYPTLTLTPTLSLTLSLTLPLTRRAKTTPRRRQPSSGVTVSPCCSACSRARPDSSENLQAKQLGARPANSRGVCHSLCTLSLSSATAKAANHLCGLWIASHVGRTYLYFLCQKAACSTRSRMCRGFKKDKCLGRQICPALTPTHV